ncbi:hypothetical protein SAMN06298216_1462 [Spirosomataceae bacterium TFI 002]|nr:hypothetical protein SAMN06298216_1462 [Spirosomataceae bacterium TFI 002]
MKNQIFETILEKQIERKLFFERQAVVMGVTHMDLHLIYNTIAQKATHQIEEISVFAPIESIDESESINEIENRLLSLDSAIALEATLKDIYENATKQSLLLESDANDIIERHYKENQELLSSLKSFIDGEEETTGV